MVCVEIIYILVAHPPLPEILNSRRVCIVNNAGEPVMDVFVEQTEPVTDYRTKVSGACCVETILWRRHAHTMGGLLW